MLAAVYCDCLCASDAVCSCGKTEIARRLAKLADAPFIKVRTQSTVECQSGIYCRRKALTLMVSIAGGSHQVHRSRVPRP